MADDYLTIVQNVIDELGVLGGDAVTNVTALASVTDPEYLRIIKMVADADMWVLRQHLDWDFMWYEYSETLAADDTSLPAITGGSPPTIKHWLKDAFWLDRTGSNPIQLKHLPWKDWRNTFRSGLIQTSEPTFCSQRPDGTIEIDVKSSKAYTATGEGYKRPEKMTVDGSESPIPDEFRRIIEVRAMIDWSARDDATEILNLKVPEYDLLMLQLEGSELPGQDPNLLAENEDLSVEVI